MNASRSVGDVKCQSSHLENEVSFIFIGFLAFADFSRCSLRGPHIKGKTKRDESTCHLHTVYIL